MFFFFHTQCMRRPLTGLLARASSLLGTFDSLYQTLVQGF